MKLDEKIKAAFRSAKRNPDSKGSSTAVIGDNAGDLDRLLATSSQQILEECIEFETAPSSSLNPLISLHRDFIILNPENKDCVRDRINYDGHHSDIKDSDGIPIPRRVLFPPEHVRLKWQKVSRIGAGLQNMGNTCFLNATLQCLTYTPPLANFLQSGQHNHDCQQLYFCVLCKMREHVSKAFSCTERSFRPLPFIRYLKCIAKHFVYGKQEDAHEFLRLLLDAMQNRCLQGLSKLDRYSKTTTVIHQIFGGFLRSRVKCLTCKGESDTLQPMMDMILDLKNAPDVEKSLQQFVRPDILQGDNSYACERCKRKMTATKTLTVHRAPNILTLTLKRFCSSTIAKISKNIRFAEMLNLRPYMSQPRGPAILYHLYAILVHEGHSCRGGHYCSYVKASNGMWYEMNDAWVCQTQIGKVLGKQAYVLFYVRGSSIKEAAGLCGIKPAMQPSTATTHVSPFNAVASQVSKAGNVPLSNTVASPKPNKSSTLTIPDIQAVLPLETKRTSSKALPVVAHKPKGQGRVSQVLNNGSDCGHRNSCSSMKGTQLATLNNCSTLPHPKMMRSNTALGWNVEQYRADRVAPVDCVEWHVCSHIRNPKRKDSRYLGKIDLEFLSSCRPSGVSSAIRSRHENGAFPAKREITKIIERKKTKRQNSIELCDTDKNIFNGKEEKQENCKKVEWESKERQKRNDLRKDRVLKNARRQWRKRVRILSRNLARTGKTISEEQWQVTRDAHFAREASKSWKFTNDVFNDRERAYKKTTRLTSEEHAEKSVPISCLADGEKEVVEVKANDEIFPMNRAESIDTSESLHDPSSKEHVNIKQKKARNDTWRDNSLTDNYNGTAGCGDVSPDLLTPFGIALQKTPQFKKNRKKRKRTQHEDSDSEERSKKKKKKKKKKKSKKEVVTVEMTDSRSTIGNKQENGSCKLFQPSDHRADSETPNGTSNEEIVEDTMDVSIFGTPRRSVPSVRWDRHVNGIVSGQHGMGPNDAGATERRDRDNDVVSNLLKYKYDKAYGAEVLSWDGERSRLSLDAESDARKARHQRQLDKWDLEYDKGKTKKVKKPKFELTRDYNPFQKVQNLRNESHDKACSSTSSPSSTMCTSLHRSNTAPARYFPNSRKICS